MMVDPATLTDLKPSLTKDPPAMPSYSPFEDDVLHKGTLIVRVTSRTDGKPIPRQRLRIKACGYH
jgi:hypothetical protein